MTELPEDTVSSTGQTGQTGWRFTAASGTGDPSAAPDSRLGIEVSPLFAASSQRVAAGSDSRFMRGAARRDAFRAIAAAGTVLLTIIGLSSREQVEAKTGSVHQSNRGSKGRPCKCARIGLTSNMSEPFSLEANTGATVQATCPQGFIALSGGLQGGTAVEAPCMIRESHPAPDGEAWIVNVFCTAATNTPLRVGAICFSESSFNSLGEGESLGWGR